MAIERPIVERIVRYTYFVEPYDLNTPYVQYTLQKGRYADDINPLTGEPRWVPEGEPGTDGRKDEVTYTIPWGVRDELVRNATGDISRADEADAELPTLPEAHDNYASYVEWSAKRAGAEEFITAANAADDPMKRHIYLMHSLLKAKGDL